MFICKSNSIEIFTENGNKAKRDFNVKNIGYSLIIIMNSIACVHYSEFKKNIAVENSKSNSITTIEIPSKFIATRSDYQTKPVGTKFSNTGLFNGGPNANRGTI